MNDNTLHRVLLQFKGKDMQLYEKIRNLAYENNMPISTYMRLLLRQNINTDIIIKGKAETLKQQANKKNPAKTGKLTDVKRNKVRN